jgi:exopolyphosphatase/guanosine-5'-triphosphate,3'-diphosphate pyrophosphatase
MKKRLALFDLGTNTFNLLVCDVENGSFTEIYNTKFPVKLGEGGLANNLLLPRAMERGIMALRTAVYEITNLGCDSVLAIGTAALRDAKNAKDFTDSVMEHLNIDIEIIDGLREADLIYKGVRASNVLTQDCDLIMDIGGGSVEFILGNKDEAFKVFSFNAGVAKLLQKFDPTEPILTGEISKIHAFLDTTFAPLIEAVKTHKPNRLVGSSGSFDSVRDMIVESKTLASKLSEHMVSRELFREIYDSVISKTKEERFEIPGLVPLRVDYIVMAVILMDYIQNKFAFNGFIQCDYALKEGLLIENLQ